MNSYRLQFEPRLRRFRTPRGGLPAAARLRLHRGGGSAPHRVLHARRVPRALRPGHAPPAPRTATGRRGAGWAQAPPRPRRQLRRRARWLAKVVERVRTAQGVPRRRTLPQGRRVHGDGRCARRHRPRQPAHPMRCSASGARGRRARPRVRPRAPAQPVRALARIKAELPCSSTRASPERQMQERQMQRRGQRARWPRAPMNSDASRRLDRHHATPALERPRSATLRRASPPTRTIIRGPAAELAAGAVVVFDSVIHAVGSGGGSPARRP